MKEILNKMNDLVSALDIKIVEFDKKNIELDKIIDMNNNLVEKNKERSASLDDREKKVAHVENIVRISEESKARLNTVNDIAIENTKVLKQISVEKEALSKENERLQGMIALYRSKNESLVEEKKKLEEDRKEMRSKILQELSTIGKALKNV